MYYSTSKVEESMLLVNYVQLPINKGKACDSQVLSVIFPRDDEQKHHTIAACVNQWPPIGLPSSRSETNRKVDGMLIIS